MNEKGVFSKATQEALLEILKDLVKDQKPAVKLSASIGGKLVLLVGDDIFAEKLPKEIKEKTREFFDALIVEKDIDKAIMLGIELVPLIYELFKKDELPAPGVNPALPQ